MNIAEQLQKTSLFRDISAADLDALDDVMLRRTFQAGEVLFNVGDPGDSMYIIQSGQVRIYAVDDHGQGLTLMYYGPTQIFGEFSLLDNKPRSASAAALSDLQVFELRRDDFMDFLMARPQVSIAMMVSLADRARYTTAYVEEVVRWVKRMASGDYQAAIDDIIDTEVDQSTPVQALIGAFLHMVRIVQHREEQLKRQVERLRVQIDPDHRSTQVMAITRTDFFSNLKAQAKKLREETSSTTLSEE